MFNRVGFGGSVCRLRYVSIYSTVGFIFPVVPKVGDIPTPSAVLRDRGENLLLLMK